MTISLLLCQATCKGLFAIYRKLPKIHPPFLHTTYTFRQKWGGGVCSNIQFILCIRPLPLFLVVLNTHEIDNCDNCHSFLKEQRCLC